MIADANVVAVAWDTGSTHAKAVIPQQPIRKHLLPSNPVCVPAENPSKCITLNGASTGNPCISLDDLLQVGFDRA